MTRGDIERIIRAEGYRCEFQDRVSAKGNGKSWQVVYAWTRGGKSPRGRSLGRVEEVLELGPDDFAQKVRERLAGVESRR
jgi:hypothetical protein